LHIDHATKTIKLPLVDPRLPSLTILVVDDEADIRDMLLLILENAGMHGIAVATAEDAQKLLEDTTVDLMVLDWMLPGISGVELTRRLKNDERYNTLPIILLTARVERADRIRAFEVGANDFITKPFSPKDLLTRIKSAIKITQNLN
jgi:two-component system phosphate regulon response regulator PhoB